MREDVAGNGAALRLAIERHETQLETALKELVRAAETRASLGHYVARYPWHFVLGGLVLGVWLGRGRQPSSSGGCK